MKRTVTPLFCMNAEDFERLTGYFGDTCLTDLLQAYQTAISKRGEYFVTPYFATRGNDILEKKGDLRPGVPRRYWEQLTKMAAGRLGLKPE